MSCSACVLGVTKVGKKKCAKCLKTLGYTPKQVSLMRLATVTVIVQDRIPNQGISIMPDGTIQFIHGRPYMMRSGKVVFYRPPGGVAPVRPKRKKRPPPPPIKAKTKKRKAPPPPPGKKRKKKRKQPPPPPTRDEHA